MAPVSVPMRPACGSSLGTRTASGASPSVGEIDIANVADTEAALVPMAESGVPLVLDLAELTYCDSQGVAMLFRLGRHASDHRGSLTVANPQGIVLRVLEITRLGEAIDVVVDL